MEFIKVNEYLDKLRTAAEYKELTEPEKEAAVFEANELLLDYFPENKLTARAVALQTLFMVEGEEEEFSRLKRQGVKSYAVKGVSVSFEGSGISPDVINILDPKSSKASVGRLV